MEQDEGAVAMARLTQQADVPAIRATRRWVADFARAHGMTGTADLTLAVSEVVTNAVRHAYPADRPGPVTTDVATDGEWLTVRVTDRGRGTPSTSLGAGLPLVIDLADRTEITCGDGGRGTIVLMEFPMAAVQRPQCSSGHRRVRRRVQPHGRPRAVAGSARLGFAHTRR